MDVRLHTALSTLPPHPNHKSQRLHTARQTRKKRSKQIRSSRKRGIVSQKISQSRVQKWKPSISPGNLDRKTQNTWNTKLLLRKETAQQTRNEMQGGNRCSTKKRGKTGAGGGIDLGPLLVQCRGGTTCTRGCARGGRSRRAV